MHSLRATFCCDTLVPSDTGTRETLCCASCSIATAPGHAPAESKAAGKACCQCSHLDPWRRVPETPGMIDHNPTTTAMAGGLYWASVSLAGT